MKRIYIFASIAFMFLNTINLLAQTTAADTINGVIDENEFDDDGILTSVVFNVLDSDFNMESYVVVNDAVGKQLLEHVGENIDIIGTIKKNPDGTKSIVVKAFFVSEEEDYSPPDDNNDE